MVLMFKEMTSMRAEITHLRQELEKHVGEQRLEEAVQAKMVLQEVDMKFKTYAQAARETQVTLAREQEVEKEARAARSLNLRFVGVEEKNDEDMMETVTTLCKDVLKVATPRFVRAVRVGRSEKGPRTILVRFNAVEDRSIVLCNRHMLKGMREDRSKYLGLVEEGLHGCDDDPTGVTNVLLASAKRALSRNRTRENTWFDEECRSVRNTAMQTVDGRHVAFRNYKNLVKRKRRTFTRQQQVRFEEELMKTPRLFWSRLSSTRKPSELSDSILREYVTDLYFVPGAGQMAQADSTCTFEEEEVSKALREMKSGKAADIDGVTLEIVYGISQPD
ncbi:hypothetical protein R1sor_027185 [Riccia sorocarpa]|uniref:Uncharacterized protein n=1 Tax=Riccia sorocarpa TaxID=122646 RepID=A0ABD3GDG7_9MARC